MPPNSNSIARALMPRRRKGEVAQLGPPSRARRIWSSKPSYSQINAGIALEDLETAQTVLETERLKLEDLNTELATRMLLQSQANLQLQDRRREQQRD